MTRLTFLGTGGGRFAAILQARATGGLYLELGEHGGVPAGGPPICPGGRIAEEEGRRLERIEREHAARLAREREGRGGAAPRPDAGAGARPDGVRRFHIDPGPGALVRMLACGFSPLSTGALLISHCHPDHYGDAEMLIEGMTEGGNKRQGAVLASRSVLEGIPSHGPAISRYHASKPALARAMAPGDRVDLFGTLVTAAAAAHSDPSAVGFVIDTGSGTLGYVCDTALEEKVIKAYVGSRVLVLPVTRPLNAKIPFHLDVEDAADLAAEVKPELVLMNHFGMRVLREGPEKAATWMEERTGIRTVAATDGMQLEMGLGPLPTPPQLTSS